LFSFFFSRRRRHTRWPRDWSSDVCSSDLEPLTPLGGPKGSGLSLMIEILVSVLVNNPVIAPALAGKGAGRMNGLAIAVQIDAFGEANRFKQDVAHLARALKVVPLAAGTASILMPGERGFA